LLTLSLSPEIGYEYIIRLCRFFQPKNRMGVISCHWLPEMQIESVFFFGLRLWRIDIGIIVLQDIHRYGMFF